MNFIQNVRKRTVLAGISALASGALFAGGPAAVQAAQGTGVSAGLTPQAVSVPNISSIETSRRDANTACTLPDGTNVDFIHCYTPQQIRSAYGVNNVPNMGAGQTIVLVDAYGSPTAASDLGHFHDTFFPTLPAPDFEQIFPLGNPQYNNTSNGNGQSGPNGAAGWSGEATLDIEWAYSIAPEAHIVLLAVPPAETEGVQGFPNLFKAISGEIAATPRGTVFSMSFAVTEQTFGGATQAQTSKFDAVFQQGLAKNDNFFAASGDNGTANASKQQKDGRTYPYPTAQWPASSPYVVSVGGTQLQDGWIWSPTSNEAFDASGNYNPAYFASAPTTTTLNAVWNESWLPAATGGGVSTIYQRPSWQAGVASGYGNARLVPDTSWDAAVNGGVDVYITAYPQYNCGNTTGCWNIFGGTSSATPQTAALVALANAARASAHKAPLGFLDPILYGGVGASAYNDVTPVHQGSAPPVFAGTDLTPAPVTVHKSVGDLVDNQIWEVPVAGYPVTSGYDLTTGWGTPNAGVFVSTLAGLP